MRRWWPPSSVSLLPLFDSLINIRVDRRFASPLPQARREVLSASKASTTESLTRDLVERFAPLHLTPPYSADLDMLPLALRMDVYKSFGERLGKRMKAEMKLINLQAPKKKAWSKASLPTSFRIRLSFHSFRL